MMYEGQDLFGGDFFEATALTTAKKKFSDGVGFFEDLDVVDSLYW